MVTVLLEYLLTALLEYLDLAIEIFEGGGEHTCPPLDLPLPLTKIIDNSCNS